MEACNSLSDDLVKLALKRDKGKDANLISFECKPFTNKGSNYTGFIAMLLVKYFKEGFKGEESYVVKLNPEQPFHCFTEVFEDMFGREIDVLSTFIVGMNGHLEKLNLPPIKAPKLYASNPEKGKQYLIIENLSIQGFQDCNLREELDMNHAILVLKELGRFHASSLLYEEPFYPKTIQDLSENFKEPRHDCNHTAYKCLNSLVSKHAEGIRNILKKDYPKYEKAVKWLDENGDKIYNCYIKGFSPEKPFDIFAHGDVQTNNLLFKYDENKVPVDVRFVDFQCSKKASPATDLNYFFHSSLNRNLRVKEVDIMLVTYYESFAQVLKLAGKDPPFSYEELITEVNNRKFFGLSCAIFLLPFFIGDNVEVLTATESEKDEVDEVKELRCEDLEAMLERKGTLQDRLFSVFEEMIDDHLFD